MAVRASTVTGTHFDLKIFVDSEKGRVLFAEADSDFVEVLFSFLTLPLGTILRLVGKTPSQPEPTIGCFGGLPQTVTSLGNEHFLSEKFKDVLLQPRSFYEDMHQRLKINIDDTETKYYICANDSCDGGGKYMSLYHNTWCCCCGHSMTVVKKANPSEHGSKGKGFFSKALKFIVSDNLEVSPVPGTFIGHLNKLGTNMVEERTVKLGLNELIELLKCTLHSTTPLTDLFGAKPKKPVSSVPKKVSLDQRKPSGEGTKINVKVVLNKTSKEFLYVIAGGDFIDFLFSLLLIPLGQMLHIMEGQSCVVSVDALYNSALSLDPNKHFSSRLDKYTLLSPKLPPHFICKNHLFPLIPAPIRCTIDGVERKMTENMSLTGELGSGGFVREEEVFIVLDDLTVEPFSAAEAISIINRRNVSFSDLEERTVSIGMAEGIRIARASFNSSCAISNGLLGNNNVFKEPKQDE